MLTWDNRAEHFQITPNNDLEIYVVLRDLKKKQIRPKHRFGRPKQCFGRPKRRFGRPKRRFKRPKRCFGRLKRRFGRPDVWPKKIF